MLCIAAALGAGKLFLADEHVRWLEENRGAVFAAGFLMNIMAGKLRESGAFELYLDDQLIFSKLQTGGIPPFDHVVALVQRALGASQ